MISYFLLSIILIDESAYEWLLEIFVILCVGNSFILFAINFRNDAEVFKLNSYKPEIEISWI